MAEMEKFYIYSLVQLKKKLKLGPSAVALAYTPITGEIEAGES